LDEGRLLLTPGGLQKEKMEISLRDRNDHTKNKGIISLAVHDFFLSLQEIFVPF